MAAATWPGSLPTKPLVNGFSQIARDPLVRFQPEYGPAQVRARASQIIYDVSVIQNLTDAQKTTLQTFYKTTLEYGALRFNWTDHVNTGTVEYRFLAPPAYASVGPFWRVSYRFEIMP